MTGINLSKSKRNLLYTGISPYRAVNTSHHGYKNQSVVPGLSSDPPHHRENSGWDGESKSKLQKTASFTENKPLNVYQSTRVHARARTHTHTHIYIYIYIYIYEAPILDVSRSHTTMHHSR